MRFRRPGDVSTNEPAKIGAFVGAEKICRRRWRRTSVFDLIREGIDLDFSMGYGTVNGFRGSIASPVKWFDLSTNETTNLTVYPFCYMEANSFYELKQTPEQAYKELQQLYAVVKKVNGTFVTIWHNHFLGTDPMFNGWKGMDELFLREDLYWDFLQPA